ncbi:MAG: O-phospho-L-seryl-tRNA:Cys-tRNA synthase [Candidatus Methanospirare jalkutatii]|nr:O-phospho-L-seryl-tRNA:Cys-tRNA synthase [Candidatus Methanospirare jalkutatii]
MERDVRVRKIFEAMFLLEDMREIFRNALPTGLNEAQESEFQEYLERLQQVLDELKAGKGTPLKFITDRIELRAREEEFININPIQPGGRLTAEARKALIAYGDGYSICDYCLAPFKLEKIRRPPVEEFHAELAEFVGMDAVRVFPGARRAFQAVTSAILEKGDIVLVSDLAHYTEFLAVEVAGGIVYEVPSGENHVITGEAFAQKIEEVREKTGKMPKLVMIEHYDYSFGNEHDVRGVGKVAKEYGIPFLYNGAYSVGMRPVNGKEIGADFVVGSGHKGMASAAPSGILATTEEFAPVIFRGSSVQGDISGRKFPAKEPELLGCTLMGATLVTMMASFPKVKERVKHWDEEVRKSNFFCDEFLRIAGNKILSEFPRKHTLTKVDTRESFDKIAKTHKRRGFFLSDELKKRGIVGEFAGSTKVWKLNTYGLSWEQVKYLADAFKEIALKYNLNVQ